MNLPLKPFPLIRRPSAAVTFADPCAGTWRLVEHEGRERRNAEEFIVGRYARSFGARVQAFMPRLFTLRDDGGAICGAFGLRCAHHRLFTEHYLDRPIELALAACAGRRVARSSIVEVGHLCGAFPGAMRLLIELLALRLHRDGFEWVAFTGTAALRNAFARVGLTPLDLGPARAERLPPEECGIWGDYYEHAPRICAGRIEVGVRRFERRRAATGCEGRA